MERKKKNEEREKGMSCPEKKKTRERRKEKKGPGKRENRRKDIKHNQVHNIRRQERKPSDRKEKEKESYNEG